MAGSFSLFSNLMGAPQRMQMGSLADLMANPAGAMHQAVAPKPKPRNGEMQKGEDGKTYRFEDDGAEGRWMEVQQESATPRLDNFKRNLGDVFSPENLSAWGAMASGRTFGDSLGGFMQASGQNLTAKKAERKEAEQRNKTRELLLRKYPDMAEWFDAGLSVPDAYAMTNKGKDEIINAGDGQLYNATQKTWITAPNMGAPGGPDPKKAFEYETGLRKEYGDDDTIKSYKKVRDSYERVRAAAVTDSGPGDIGLIFNYMKMLDPGSVVREGEFATAENAGGAGAQIANIYNKLLTGERLTPELREQFVQAADKLYSEMSTNVSEANQQYGKSAQRWGVDPNAVIMEPEKYEPLSVGKVKEVAPGITIRRTK